MRVKEWKGSVVFLHEVAEGAAGRSWGVHVAELAGVPAPVVKRAATLLAALEKHGGKLGAAGAPLAALPLFAAQNRVPPPEATPTTAPHPTTEAASESPSESAPDPVSHPARNSTPDAISDPLATAVAALDPDSMTPREALDALYRLQALQPARAQQVPEPNTYG